VRALATDLPQYRENMRAKVLDIRQAIGDPIDRATKTVRDLGKDLASQADPEPVAPVPVSPVVPPDAGWERLFDALNSVATAVGLAAVVLLFSFVMLLFWEDLRDRLLLLAGDRALYVTTKALNEASSKISRYLHRQLLLNGLHGTALGLILWGLGVPNPLVWGVLAGVLRFIPYAGPTVSTIVPILVSFASSPGWSQTVLTAVSLIGLEIVSNNVLEPWLYGRVTGISPLALLLSAFFWTWLWGWVGLVLSVPLTVCLLVMGKHFPHLQFLAFLASDEPALPLGTRLYHRLLAQDQDEAWEIVRSESTRTSVVDAFDDVVLPALSLAGHARQEGSLDAASYQGIASLAHALVSELEDLPHAALEVEPVELRVLCIPARDEVDAVLSRVLTSELLRRGVRAVSTSTVEFVSETAARLDQEPVDVVFVSSVVPTHFLHVRSICKRLLRVRPDLHIVLGLWGEDIAASGTTERLPSSPQVRPVSTLKDAIAAVHRRARTVSSDDRLGSSGAA
jgi:predicted PurR-regulated permease PerM